MPKANYLVIVATAVVTAVGTFGATTFFTQTSAEEAAALQTQVTTLEDSLASLENRRQFAMDRNTALEAQNNEQRILADQLSVQNQAARSNLEETQAHLKLLAEQFSQVEAELKRADATIDAAEQHEELARTIAPTQDNGAVHITTVLEKRGDVRLIQNETGTVTYMFRRGQQTVLMYDLDPQGVNALEECMETGKCLPMSEHPLMSHRQGHNDGNGSHMEQKTTLFQLVDWDARLVFFYYTHDTGAPISVYTFDDLDNGHLMHAEADLLRERLMATPQTTE